MKHLSKSLPKKLIVFILIFGVFIGLFLTNVNQAKAIGVLDVLDPWGIGRVTVELGTKIASGEISLASVIIGGLAHLIWAGTYWFLGICANLFSSILDFTAEKLASNLIYQGWTTTRDIVNMFFILGLIVIAFATILRIESYGMKKLLPKLIIIALLINFSFLACGMIVDATNITAKFFVDAIKKKNNPANEVDTGVGGQISSAMLVQKHEYEEDSTSTTDKTKPIDWMSIALSQLAQALAMLIAACILLLGAVLLAIRMAALWVLILMVPFAWFLGIFPKFQSLNEKWWSNFLKYAFFAPIYVFFIFLGLDLVAKLQIQALNINALDSLKKSIAVLTDYVIVIVIFGGAPMVAMSMGIHGSQAIFGFAKGALKAGALRLGKGLRMTALAPPGWLKAIPGIGHLAKLSERITPYLLRSTWRTAAEEREKEKLRQAKIGYAAGKIQDWKTRIFSLGKEKTKHADEAKQFDIDEEAKKLSLETNRDSGKLVNSLQDAINSGKSGEIRAAAAMKLLFDQKDHNDMQIRFGDWVWSDKSQYAQEHGLVGKKYGPTTDNIALKDLMFQMFEKMGVSEKQAAPFIAGLNQVAFKSGVYGAYHYTTTDKKDQDVRSTDQEQLHITASKLSTQSMRDTSRQGHATMWVKQGIDPKTKKYTFAGWDRVGLENIKDMTAGQIKDMRYNEMNPVKLELTADGIINAEKYKEKGIKTIEEEIMAIKEWSAEEKRIALENAKALSEKIRGYAVGKEAEAEKKEGEKKTKEQVWEEVKKETKKSEGK